MTALKHDAPRHIDAPPHVSTFRVRDFRQLSIQHENAYERAAYFVLIECSIVIAIVFASCRRFYYFHDAVYGHRMFLIDRLMMPLLYITQV